MYPFDHPHNCYNPRNCNVMPNRKEDDQPPSPQFGYPPYPGNYHHPSYYHYGPPQLPYVQPPPTPLPPCYYPHYYPPYPTYFIPPPPPCNYPMDHCRPRYDDYYNHPNNIAHCCGCSNHTCQPRNDAPPSLRIQEEPFHQSDRKESDDTVPPSNYTSPVIWRLPSSDVVKDNSFGNKIYDEKASEKDDVGRTGSKSPSYPVIWLPGNSGFEEMGRDKNATASKSAPEWPSNFKFIPLKFLENGSRAEPESEVRQVAPAADKMSNTRAIPVKQVNDRSLEGVERNQPSNVKDVPLKFSENGEGNRLENYIQQEPYDPLKKKETKVKTIPVKRMDEESSEKSCKIVSDKTKEENNVGGKMESKTNNTSEKKKLSTTKSSKLPPVCLRVDPRPRKTSTNSSSTSKSSSSSTSTTTSKTSAKPNKESKCGNDEPSHEKVIPVNIVNECNQSEPVIPINIVNNNKLSQDKKEQECNESKTVASPDKNASIDDISKASEVISEGSNIENRDETGLENPAQTSELKMNVDEEKVVEPIDKIDEKASGKRVLSETDAATIIQSAYRGFEVRRWHPLEKLKKIAKVRKETDNVRRQIDDIDACPPHQLDAKKKVVLGETIMNLLLQLDTIQGLHPSVKEVRKILAKELTSLEDKLDSIYRRISKEAESSKCENNIVCSSQETSKLESSKTDSMHDKITTSDAELQTKSDISLDFSSSGDDVAAYVTSSTLACEPACELDVQVDDSGTKNSEVIQEEKSPSFNEGAKEEEVCEEVKHPCFEDANPSNVLMHQVKDEQVSLKQDDISALEEEKDNLVQNKETKSIVERPADFAELNTASDELSNVNIASDDERPADYAEPNTASDELSNVNIAPDDALAKEHESSRLDEEEEKSPKCEGSIVCSDPDASKLESSKPDLVDDKIMSELQSGSDIGMGFSSSGDDVKDRVEEEEISEEVKHPCFEREMDSTVPTPPPSKQFEHDSVEIMNPSSVLEHQTRDEHATLKEGKVSDLEGEKDKSAEKKETGSTAERSSDHAELNIASDELPNVNIASDDALEEHDACNRAAESMDGGEERSSTFKANGESTVADNESENDAAAAAVGMLENKSRKISSCTQTSHADEDLSISDVNENTAAVVEDKQMVSEGFEVPEAATKEADVTNARKMVDECARMDENDSKNGVCASNNEAADAVTNVPAPKGSDALKREEVQLVEENEKLRKMIEKLVQSGNKQLDVISNLNGRVKDLEKKLQQTKKKRMKVRGNRAVKKNSNVAAGCT